MWRSLCTDEGDPTSQSRPLGRRGILLALLLAPLAACGRKGALELPPPEPFEADTDPEDDSESEEGGQSMENPDTYGDPMTFPEPGENEESAE
jgi:predicted small lipoprotein YifL